MIVVMRAQATSTEVDSVVSAIEALGMRSHLSRGEERTIVGIIGDERTIANANLEALGGVERVIPVLKPFKLASRDFHPTDSVVQVGHVPVGGGHLVVMAGPCAVESREQLLASARAVKAGGAHILRGGAFKPRTSPYSFQGLGKEGLELLAEARAETGLPVVTEVVSPTDVPLVSEWADMIQIGARNMQNFALLEAAGKSHRPVLLKRGMSATIEELLMAAEYILASGNLNVILCERGIRTFEKYTRNTLDIAAVPVLKRLSHLPVVVDPSHATGDRGLVGPTACAGVAAGSDGLIIEVHPNPEKALSDGPQSLTPELFRDLMARIRPVADAVGHSVLGPSKAVAA
jgi:3-deoxy-7-phosphoheptulonate synthase